MPTDNSLVAYRFISRRLVTEIVQQHHAAAAMTFLSSIDLDLPTEFGKFDIGLARTDPDYTNKFELAERATLYTANLTETLAGPPRDYLHATLDFMQRTLVVWFGLSDDYGRQSGNHKIAGLFADETVPDVGRVLLLLFGSVTSFSGVLPEDAPPAGWRTPSDAGGLFAILEASLESEDPNLDEWWVERDRRIYTTPLDRCNMALDYWDTAHGQWYPQERLEVLAQVFDRLENVSLVARPDDRQLEVGAVEGAAATYEQVVLGTPVWARTPELPPAEQALEELPVLDRDPDEVTGVREGRSWVRLLRRSRQRSETGRSSTGSSG